MDEVHGPNIVHAGAVQWSSIALQARSGAGRCRRDWPGPDLDAGAGNAKGADERAHAVFLAGEDMLDCWAHGAAPGIGSGDSSGIDFIGGFFWWTWLVNMPRLMKASFFFQR